MKNQLLAAFLSVVAFTSGYSQEQLSFVDNHDRVIYRARYSYESGDKVRYLTVENDGTLAITEYNEESFDTLLYHENLDNVPYGIQNSTNTRRNGNHHVDLFTHEIRIVNLHTLEITFLPFIAEEGPNLTREDEILVFYNFPTNRNTILYNLETGRTDTLTLFYGSAVSPPDVGTCNFCICHFPQGIERELLNDSIFISMHYSCEEPEYISLYDYVNDSTDYFLSVENNRYTKHVYRNIVKSGKSIYAIEGVDNYRCIVKVPDTLDVSTWHSDSLSFIRVTYPTDKIDLYTYNVNTTEVTSLLNLPDSLSSFLGIVPNHYMILRQPGDSDLLYDIKKDTSVVIGHVEALVLHSDYFYYTAGSTLFRQSMDDYKVDTLGMLDVPTIQTMSVIAKQNKLFVTAHDQRYIYDDTNGLKRINENTFYDISGFRDMDFVYHNKTFYNTELIPRKDTLTYKYNRSDFELINDYRILELPDNSPIINNNLWVRNDNAIGIEENNQMREVISDIDMNRVEIYTSLEKDYLFIQDSDERWIIDTKSLKAKRFNILDDYKIHRAFSLGKNFIFSALNFDTEIRVNWIYYPEDDKLIEIEEIIEDYRPFSGDEYGMGLNNVVPIANDRFLATTSHLHWPGCNCTDIVVCHLVIVSTDGTIKDLGGISCNSYKKIDLGNSEYYYYADNTVTLVDTINGSTRVSSPFNSSLVDLAYHNDLLYLIWVNADDNYHHYFHDRENDREVDLNIPSNTILKNYYTVGESLFGYLFDRENGDTYFAKIDSVDVTRVFDTEPLGWGQSHYVLDKELNIPAKLALINMPGIGSELFLLYEDGSLELLTDLNEGPSSMNDDKADIAIIDGNLFFEGITQETGKQLYGVPVTFDFLSSTSEINEDYYVPDITIYPNPTQEVITISGKDYSTAPNYIKIINTSGDEVFSQIGDIDATKQINVSSYPAGTYYVLIDINNRTFVKPFVKI